MVTFAPASRSALAAPNPILWFLEDGGFSSSGLKSMYRNEHNEHNVLIAEFVLGFAHAFFSRALFSECRCSLRTSAALKAASCRFKEQR